MFHGLIIPGCLLTLPYSHKSAYSCKSERVSGLIFTVTLNPAIDKTVVIPDFAAGGVNRVQYLRVDAGGKGFNVSKCLKKLGVGSTACAILGGSTGEYLLALMAQMGIDTLSVTINEQSRTNLKIIDPSKGVTTEINEPGPEVSCSVLEELKNRIAGKISPGDIVILSGSLPRGAKASLYYEWTKFYHSLGAVVFLDSDGEAMRLGVEAKPDFIKPNHHELSRIVGKNLSTEQELVEEGKKLLETGIEDIVISLGADGAIFLSADGIFKAGSLEVSVLSTVGAGDSMVAAMAYGFEKKLPRETRIRLAMAMGAASVMSEGTQAPDADLVWKLAEKVEIQRV